MWLRVSLTPTLTATLTRTSTLSCVRYHIWFTVTIRVRMLELGLVFAGAGMDRVQGFKSLQESHFVQGFKSLQGFNTDYRGSSRYRGSSLYRGSTRVIRVIRVIGVEVFTGFQVFTWVKSLHLCAKCGATC